MRSRASEEKRTSLAGMLFNPWLEMKGRAASGRLFLLVGRCALDHAHDVGLFHDQKVLAIDLDLGAGPFAEQHPVARLDVKRNELAAFVTGSRPDGDHLAFLRLFLGGVGNDDAALRLVLSCDAADDDAVVQWTEFHEFRSRLTCDAGLWRHALTFGSGLKRAVNSRCWHSLQESAKPSSVFQLRRGTAIVDTETAAFSVCTTWGIIGRKLYLIYVLRKRLDFHKIEPAILHMKEKYNASSVVLETSGVGIAIGNAIVKRPG